MSENRLHANNVISMDEIPNIGDEFKGGVQKQVKIDMSIDKNSFEQNVEKEYDRGRVHVQSRSAMPEKHRSRFGKGIFFLHPERWRQSR